MSPKGTGTPQHECARSDLSKDRSVGSKPSSPWLPKTARLDGLWRIRIGDYRVIYQILDDKMAVDIVAVRHRSQVYRSRLL
ncbi:MAG: type II toxin-antitoxin system RelE/ParE family toxin [Candidatus Latescibacterota bacterium]|nr:MAG: type II toxin-antitoxin system RelE/ParE family toxin [Candidatus Latescibacterota bacterium]